jgi:hypothetical protein
MVRSYEKGMMVRKKYEATKKVRSYEKGTKLQTWYEVTKKLMALTPLYNNMIYFPILQVATLPKVHLLFMARRTIYLHYLYYSHTIGRTASSVVVKDAVSWNFVLAMINIYIRI